MKKTLMLATLLLVLCTPAVAGDIDQPPINSQEQPSAVAQVIDFVVDVFGAFPAP